MKHRIPYLFPYSSSSTLTLLLFVLWAGFSVSISAPTFISDDVFEDRASFGRNLLQAKKPCPVDFQNQDYSIITSQCKGPDYPVDPCCKALKEFACPYASDLNDETTNCATTMFSYLSLNGGYPPGLWASECKEGTQGLACNVTSPSASVSGSRIMSIPPPLLILLSTSFLALFF